VYGWRNTEALSCFHCCHGKSSKYYIFWVYVCSLRYPACNAHAPYCHLWPVRLYSIIPHYLVNGTIFGKKLLNMKCVLIFSTAWTWNVFWYSLQLEHEMRFDIICSLNMKCVLIFSTAWTWNAFWYSLQLEHEMCFDIFYSLNMKWVLIFSTAWTW